MRCEDVQTQLSDHLDGVLAPNEAAGVAGHLAGCAACRAELEDLRAVVAMLHAVPAETMPGGLLGRISAALADEAGPEGVELSHDGDGSPGAGGGRDAGRPCEEARDLLSGRLEQALDADEAEALEAHLAGCADCARTAAQLEAVVGLLHRVPREEPPADLAARISAALGREGGEAIAPAPAAERIGHDEAEDYMTGRLEGDLDPWEDRALSAHLEACAPCARKLAELTAVVGLLGQVPREDVPADLQARVSRALALEALDEPAARPVPGGVSPFAEAPARARGGRRWSHWASSAAGAAAACAVFLVWQFLPGAGVPRIETAAVTVKQDVAVNIGFDVDEQVDGVIFQVDLPEGLKFVDDKAQPMLAQSVSWKGSLEKGKTVVPIVVRGIRPGRYEIEAFVRKGSMKRKTTIVLPVQG